MTRVASWLLLWIGYAYLIVLGDLRANPLLDGVNPQLWWSAWFTVLLAVSLAHVITGKRRPWGFLEVGILLVLGSARSAVYVANGFYVPLGVWLVLLGVTLRSWELSKGQRDPA